MRELRGVAERQAGEDAHLLLELAGDTGIDRVVAAVVRPRRHLVDDEPAVGEDEELDAQHADVLHRFGDAHGDVARLLGKLGRDARRRDADREDAVAMRVLDHREAGDRAVAAARDDARHLLAQCHALLEHAGHGAERAPGLARLRAARDGHLALAVVAEPCGLEDARIERGIDRGEILLALDQRMRRHRDAARVHEALLDRAILRDAHRGRIRAHGSVMR